MSNPEAQKHVATCKQLVGCEFSEELCSLGKIILLVVPSWATLHQVVGLFWCLLFTVSGTGSKRICFDARIETIDAKNCVDVVIMFEAISSTMEYGNSETKSLIGQQRQKGVANHVAPALSPLTSGASKRTTPRSKQYGCVEGSTRICFV